VKTPHGLGRDFNQARIAAGSSRLRAGAAPSIHQPGTGRAPTFEASRTNASSRATAKGKSSKRKVVTFSSPRHTRWRSASAPIRFSSGKTEAIPSAERSAFTEMEGQERKHARGNSSGRHHERWMTAMMERASVVLSP
jgi:hypothetical protein